MVFQRYETQGLERQGREDRQKVRMNTEELTPCMIKNDNRQEKRSGFVWRGTDKTENNDSVSDSSMQMIGVCFGVIFFSEWLGDESCEVYLGVSKEIS